MASLRKLEGRGVDNVENVPECTDRRVSNSHDVTICRKNWEETLPGAEENPWKEGE